MESERGILVSCLHMPVLALFKYQTPLALLGMCACMFLSASLFSMRAALESLEPLLTYRCTGYRLRPAGDPRVTRPPVPFWAGHNTRRAVSGRAENWVTERPNHVVFGTVRHTSEFHTVLAQEEEFHH